LFGCSGAAQEPKAKPGGPLIDLFAQTNAKVEQFQYSPDGTQIVYVSAKNGNYDLWVMKADGSGAHAITARNPVYQAFDGPTITPEWSPDGRWIAYISRGETYLLRPDGSAPPVNVSYGKGGLRPLWTADSRWLISTPGGEYVSGYGQIIRLRGAIPSGAIDATLLTDEPFGHSDPRPSPDGRLVAFTSSRPGTPGGPRQSGIWVMPAAGGSPRLLAAGIGSPRWSPDGQKLAFTVTQPSGWRNIGVVDLASGDRRMLTDSAWDEGNAQWSPDGHWIVYVANKRWNFHLMKIALDGGAPQQLTSAPGINGGWETGQVRGTFRWSPDGRTLAYTHMDAGTCSDLWTVSADGGTPRRLTNHMPEGLRDVGFVTPEITSYRSKDGLEVPMFVYMPRNLVPGRKPPLLVYARANVNGMHVNGFYPFIQYFLTQGYVVMAAQVRGSGGLGRDYARLNYGDWGGGDIDDIAAGVAHLAARGVIDPDRVVMQGGSTGGYHTSMTIVRYPDLLKAAVNFYGPTNLIHMDDYSATKATLSGVVRGDHGGPNEAPQHWRDRSAFFNLERTNTPLLLLWGDLDSGVRQTMAAEYYRAAKEMGKPVEYVLYDMEPHGWYNWRPATLADALTRVAAHYKNHVGQ
jgi:dipeptidyl aminopeptidase/acylaminoacyl peptidase